MQISTIIGTTHWGITLGLMLARKDTHVRLWARTEHEAVELREKGPDPTRFPGVTFPENLTVTSRMDQALQDSGMVILAVPSSTMRQNISLVKSHLTNSTTIVSAAKGLELGSNKRMSRVIAEEVSSAFHPNICVLSGPNLSREILQNLPAAAVVASENKETAVKAQKLLTCPNFCVFTNSDVVGVELGGALKNIIALGAGITDGLGYGNNAKAAFITRGLTEITALGVAMGANPLTFSGLAGLGDVITTCASSLSRNYFVGTQLALGRSMAEITGSMTEVAEGVNTTLVARNLAQHLGMEMPITGKIFQILYEGADPRQAAIDLMGGNARHELSGRRWRLFSLFRRKITTKSQD
jgi:glycerol-3-phosphate dehydrogenase (NAD(P)+)